MKAFLRPEVNAARSEPARFARRGARHGRLGQRRFRSSWRTLAGTVTEPTEFVIRNALRPHDGRRDSATSPNADVHVRNGAIAAVGRALQRAGRASVIDGAGMLVLPGLVETHWHIWGTLSAEPGRRPARARLLSRRRAPSARSIPPKDMYVAARLAAAEAINSGITFVHDWCHNVRGPEYRGKRPARARRSRHPRAVFVRLADRRRATTRPIDLARPRAPRRAAGSDYANGGLLTLGLAWRGAASEAIAARLHARRRARPADLRAREQLPERAPAASRRSRKRNLSRLAHAGDSRDLVDAGGDPRARGQSGRA